jgi:hypothetical protein
MISTPYIGWYCYHEVVGLGEKLSIMSMLSM